ncbi:hypothetical protein Syun_002437 [Stephania yunnanensis]|uniref:Homeobox domain-containing protein n=1 Tax=Stephania yunnanensis TaxID=152371 RepID=A0AAP0LHK2_9MAGN
MATFFHGSSEMETDGLQTLYLMNPGYVGYTDAQQPNMVFINPGNSSSLAHQHQQAAAPPPPPHHSHQNHHFVGIPLQATATSPSAASQHDIAAAAAVHHGFIPRLHYNLWTSIDPNSTTPNASDHLGGGGVRRSVPAQQGLSLSLYGRADSDIPTSVISPASGDEMRVSGGGGGGGGGGGSTSSASASASAVSNGTANTTTGMQSVLLGSKYLKAAQELLDEVVNVGNGIKSELSKGGKDSNQHSKVSRDSTVVTGHEGSNCGGESSGKRGGSADLSTAEKQELQMKKAKLVSMLDEVEQRYRQYHHQMQIVVSSFEQAAGVGSAKTYTALALQTISKQFRCLKDAIGGQIKATSKSLGEEDLLGGKGEGSRLRYVDHQLRQQRALQQLGMIQHNAWRPQRGLPERSVSILRAWLFEHFLHPYPKDSDKLMLAKQTGLTRSQVSNWFINARVRLWKPMVEEMYMEETKNEEQNGMDEKTSKNEHHHHHHHHQLNEESGSARSSAQQENINSPIRTDQTRNHNIAADGSIDPNASMSNITVPASAMEGNIRTQGSFFLMRSPDSTTEVNNMAQGNSKKSRSNEMQDSPTSIHSIGMEMKPGEMSRDFAMKFDIERQNRNGYSLITSAPNNGGGGGGGGFGPYPIGVDIGRFDPEQFAPRFSGNGVSLTLGLPHCETLPLSAAQQSYLSSPTIQLSRGLEIGGGDANNFCGINTTPPPNSHSTAAYESINLQNRKRFAAQLLPDFVA